MNSDLLAKPAPASWALPTKIGRAHLDRLAVVYVRQSTVQQVHEHQESTRMQYGLVHRATELGWPAERVLVIDDDLGKSGTSIEGRVGFQRLVSEVSLDHVGIIFGIEMSRLARSCKDWHQLLEICALFGTLIADLDGIYDPAHYNDRLLLGLKGTMSEAELHVLQQRLNQGRLAKAQRGELIVGVPTGYVQRPSAEVAFDPDEQVQHVIRLIFRKFDELGTLNAVLRYLVRQGIQVGVRVREGPAKGELEWHRPSRVMLQNLLKHPIYAGAYAYGRRQIDPRRKRAGRPASGRVVRGAEDCRVLLKDHFPAYLTWEQFERNQARLQANRSRAEAIGAVRNGAALLSGLATCGLCGSRMTVRYDEDRKHYAYVCSRRRSDYGEETCQQLAGACLDSFVRQQALAALEPAALELSLAATAQLEAERSDLDRLWQQRVERATYEAERAGRQYRLVEPENRLVARQLERDWEEKLTTRQRLAEDYDRFQRQQPRLLSEGEREAIRRLARDLPTLWDAPTTTAAERKEVLRQVITRVVVTAQGESERVEVTIEWAGGARTAAAVTRPVGRLEQLSYYPQLCQRARELAAAALTPTQIAERLNVEGFRPPKRRERFGRQGVRDLLLRLGTNAVQARPISRAGLGTNEWWLPDLAREIPLSDVTLHSWIKRGWVRARQQAEPPRRWIIEAASAEVERLREMHQRPLGYYARRVWTEEEGQAII
jgi:DNA invertase Pin-like site-specific DNA recombinase